MDVKIIVAEALIRAETILRNMRWNLAAGRIDLHEVGTNSELVAKELARLSTFTRTESADRTVRRCGCARCAGECPACSPGLRPCAACDEHFAELAK